MPVLLNPKNENFNNLLDFDTYNKSSERSNQTGHLHSRAGAFTAFTHIKDT